MVLFITPIENEVGCCIQCLTEAIERFPLGNLCPVVFNVSNA